MPCVSLQRKRVEFQKSSSEIQQLLLKLGFICENDDSVGNITQIDDNAQQTIYFNGRVVSPSQKFEYDALYRLTKATGREHVSINASSEPEAEGYNQAQISPQDGTAMRNYVREWQYDSVGNILSLIHNANGNAWTRSYDYASDNNRLSSTTVGQTTVNYTYNAHGSMTSMPHLQGMQWDFSERLSHITRGTTEAYYNYDGSGQRVRKVVEKNGVTETRLYLGGFEIWRKTVNGVLNTERETLHVMDDQKRVAIVETLTIDNAVAVANPVPVQRYQLDNHLGSASMELDDSANIVSYEEYYPYGDTSYQAGRSASEVSQKRYRYTGKEKDEESGLYYHGARYYACWLGRWTASDPAGLVDGVNLYMYVRGNPVSGVDPSGTTTEEKVDEGKVFPTFEEVEIKGEGGANEKNGSVNEIKNQIEDEDKILFDAWLYELINEPMDKDLIKGIDNEKNIVENSVFDFDDVGKKTLAHIKKINYSPLQKMIKEINEISKEKIKSSPVDKSNENPYFDTATNTIRYNSNQELFGNYVDQFIHELTHVLQKLEERYKSRPIPISLEVEAFKMQFESMESDGRTLMKNSLIWENYSVFKANQNNLSNYGTWLFRMIYSKQNEKDGIKIEKYNNDYIK